MARISEKGLHALRNAEPMEEGTELILEIMSRLDGPIDRMNCIDIINDLIRQYGSEQGALAAIRSGDATFEKAT